MSHRARATAEAGASVQQGDAQTQQSARECPQHLLAPHLHPAARTSAFACHVASCMISGGFKKKVTFFAKSKPAPDSAVSE